MPTWAASEKNVILAEKYLRCAAFYVAGSTTVNKPEVKQELQDRANRSLYHAELLLDSDRPLVKEKFETARKKFFTEIESAEVKADPRGFLKYMGGYCNDLQGGKQAPSQNPAPIAPKPSATTPAPAATPDSPPASTPAQTAPS